MNMVFSRVRRSIRLPDDHPYGSSWGERFTPEQHLRANSALGSIETDVFMDKKDEAEIVSTAKLLLRGVNRMSWSA